MTTTEEINPLTMTYSKIGENTNRMFKISDKYDKQNIVNIKKFLISKPIPTEY